jgi:hypothetical protein
MSEFSWSSHPVLIPVAEHGERHPNEEVSWVAE